MEKRMLGPIKKVEKTVLNLKTGECHTVELKGKELEDYIAAHNAKLKKKQEDKNG